MGRRERGNSTTRICSATDIELIGEGAPARLDLRLRPPWTSNGEPNPPRHSVARRRRERAPDWHHAIRHLGKHQTNRKPTPKSTATLYIPCYASVSTPAGSAVGEERGASRGISGNSQGKRGGREEEEGKRD
jgi:hypothetical protein